jgi:hypothetical protein
LKDERHPLSRRELELGRGSGGSCLERERRAEGKGVTLGAKGGAGWLDRDLRLLQAVAEARLDLKAKTQCAAAHSNHASDEPLRAAAHRHEVLNLAHAFRRQKAGDQNVCAG